MVENDAPKESYDARLEEKGQGRIREGEVKIRYLPERDAGSVLKNIAEIDERGKVCVLPEYECKRP